MTLSAHFRRSLAAFGMLAVLLSGAYLWLERHIHNFRVPATAIALPADIKEAVTYNENRHTITITTAKGTTEQYSRNPKIEIHKDGTVKVTARTWGPDIRPFLGIGYSDTGRVYTGCQLFYFHSFDAAASFGWTADDNKPVFQPMLSLSYNFWSNTSINIGANPLPIILRTKPEIAIFLSVRL